jgi:hypothetical protein
MRGMTRTETRTNATISPPPVGLEGTASPSGYPAMSEKCSAYSGAVRPDSPSPPFDLALVIDRWPALTPALRAKIVSLVEGEA